MIKRDITETVYEYDKEGKLLKKTVTETHEEESNAITTYPSWSISNDPYCGHLSTTKSDKNDCCANAVIATKDTCTTITG